MNEETNNQVNEAEMTIEETNEMLEEMAAGYDEMNDWR